MCYVDDPAEVWNETERTARKSHRCCECGGHIPAGRRYLYFSGIHDGTPFSEHMHAECAALWRFVVKEVCGGEGGMMLGGLGEEIAQREMPELGVLRDLFDAAKAIGMEPPL